VGASKYCSNCDQVILGNYRLNVVFKVGKSRVPIHHDLLKLIGSVGPFADRPAWILFPEMYSSSSRAFSGSKPHQRTAGRSPLLQSWTLGSSLQAGQDFGRDEEEHGHARHSGRLDSGASARQ
jgi:hypothetical protein